MKLTAKQNMIIYCLQQGWVLITDMEMNYVLCCNVDFQFQFSLTIFWNLVNKDLIRQQSVPPFNYILTDIGLSTKTRKIDLSNNLTNHL